MIARATAAWAAFAQRHAVAVVLAMLALTGTGLGYTLTHIGINTDNADMISRDVDWRATYIGYQQSFPQYTDNLVVVIDGATAGLAADANQAMARALRQESALFPQVYVPGGGAFFARNGLLYLEVDALETLADRLLAVQPFLGRLSAEPSLESLFGLLVQALRDQSGASDLDLDPVLTELAAGFDANRQGRFYRFPWQQLIGGEDTGAGARRGFIELRPQLNYDALAPAARPIARIRALASELGVVPARGLRLRITGQAALESDELYAVSRGAALGGALALLAVAVILYAGLRSAWLLAASLLTLITGLIGTAAFAAAAVGTINLISVAFAVLYIGLGIDYAIHLCLRYRELVGTGLPPPRALPTAAGDVGASLVLCTVTTAAGFYAFIPTAYAGVAQLGLISGTGMFISLFVSLTLLPALLALRPQTVSPGRAGGLSPRLAAIPQRHRRLLQVLAIAAGLAAAATLPWISFDADTLALGDPEAESVTTYRELLADPKRSPESIVALTADRAAAHQLSQRLAALPAVGQVLSLADFVPNNQDAKLAIIQDLAFSLALSEPAALKTAPLAQRVRARDELERALDDYRSANPQADAAGRLQRALAQWRTAFDQWRPAVKQQRLEVLQQSLLATLPPRLRALRSSLEAQPVTRSNLPQSLRQRWVDPAGHYRVEARPSADLNQQGVAAQFVDAVQNVAPDATGLLVLEHAAADTVVQSFVAAFTYAAVGIALLLLLLLRRVGDTLRVLAPLALVALLVAAATVVFGTPFNFANIIALPLLLGVGVDSGIHVVQRMRGAAPESGLLLTTSTARAVFFSGLTSIAGFGGLAFSYHAGTASMGQLLTIGMIATLAATLIVLPALLPRQNAHQKET